MGARPDLRRVMRPLGPVAVYAASNFPFAFSVAGVTRPPRSPPGCPVVLVASSRTPPAVRGDRRDGPDALSGGGRPGRCRSPSPGVETGRALIRDPRITAGAFTGSIGGGRALFDLAVSRPVPIPFYGELGSVNPAFVTRGASERGPVDVADGFVASMTMGAGQFCTKPGLLLVPRGSAVVDLVGERVAKVSGARLLNERIQRGYAASLDSMAARPASRSPRGRCRRPTTLRTPWRRPCCVRPRHRCWPTPGWARRCSGRPPSSWSTTTTTSCSPSPRGLAGQLTATVCGDGDDALVARLLTVLAGRAGRVLLNGWPTGVSVTYAAAARWPLPGDDRGGHHLGGDSSSRPVRAPGRLPGRAGAAAASRPPRRESLGHPAARRRTAGLTRSAQRRRDSGRLAHERPEPPHLRPRLDPHRRVVRRALPAVVPEPARARWRHPSPRATRRCLHPARRCAGAAR